MLRLRLHIHLVLQLQLAVALGAFPHEHQLLGVLVLLMRFGYAAQLSRYCSAVDAECDGQLVVALQQHAQEFRVHREALLGRGDEDLDAMLRSCIPCILLEMNTMLYGGST